MAHDFIPDEFWTFGSACEAAARFSFGTELAEALTPTELAEVAEYAQTHLRKHPNDRIPADSGLAPAKITALLKRSRRQLKQISQCREKMRQRLYSDALKSWILSQDGQRDPVPSRIWASKSFDTIIETGRLRLTISDSYVDRTVEGPILIRRDEIEQFFSAEKTPAVHRASASVSSPARNRGGSPTKYDWHDIWAELCRIIYEEGLPKTRGELVRKIQSWHQSEYGIEPSDEILKPKMSLLFNRLKLDSRN